MSEAKNPEKGTLLLQTEHDMIHMRGIVRGIATELGFSLADLTRIVTAASELARNILKYAGSGTLTWKIVTNPHKNTQGLELIFKDNGPGIADIDQAMQMGYSTSKGLGLGLPGAKRLMDEMNIESTHSVGTVVTVIKWLKHR